MSIRVKTFRISNETDEQNLNSFLENKVVRHWGTEYSGDPSLGIWNVIVAFEEREGRTNDARSEGRGGRNEGRGNDRRDGDRRDGDRRDGDRRDGDRRDGDRRDGRRGENDASRPAVSREPKREKLPREEHVVDVPEADRPLYEALRKWRNARAREENLRPVALFSNKQLEDIVKTKPGTAEQLRGITAEMTAPYFERYSQEMLGFISGSHAPESAPSQASQDATA
ncbi:MAG: HRDC domain-containing protein [Candidatus Kapaibacterium sp.]|jgi:superfamily II DNA helicase RecQ